MDDDQADLNRRNVWGLLKDPAEPTVKKSNLKSLFVENAASLTQIMALVIGLPIALYQSYALRESIDTQTWASVTTQLTEVDKAFVEHPELVPFIYENVPIKKGDKKYPRAYAVATLVIDMMDSATVLGNHIDNKIFEPETWDHYYEWQFKNSPIICSIIKEEGSIYGKEIRERGRESCPVAPE